MYLWKVGVIMTQRELIKYVVIGSVVLILLVFIGVWGYFAFSNKGEDNSSVDVSVLAQEMQQNVKGLQEVNATTVVEKVVEVVGPVVRVEKGKKGYCTFYTPEDIPIQAKIVSQALWELKVDDVLVYVKKTGTAEVFSKGVTETGFAEVKSQILQVKDGLKVESAEAYAIWQILKKLQINTVTEVGEQKKVLYIKSNSVQFNLKLSGGVLTEVQLEKTGDILYSGGEVKGVLSEYIPMFGLRVAIPTMVQYQVGKMLGEGVEIQVPPTLADATDSWELYLTDEGITGIITGDIVTGEKRQRGEFEFTLTDNVVTQLAVNGKKIK